MKISEIAKLLQEYDRERTAINAALAAGFAFDTVDIEPMEAVDAILKWEALSIELGELLTQLQDDIAAMQQPVEAYAEAWENGDFADMQPVKVAPTQPSGLYAIDPAERSHAIIEIGRERDFLSLPALIDLLQTEADLNLVEDVTWSLVRLGERAVPALLNLLNTDHALARHNVVHVLGKLRDPRAIDGLIEATRDTDALVRHKAVYALAQIRDMRAIPALIALLEDPVPDVQLMARDVISGFGEGAMMPLVDALRGASPAAQEYMVSLLGELGATLAVPSLIRLLDHADWELRVAIATALGEIGGADAADALDRLCDDPDSRVQAVAGRMLDGLR